jgi:phosphate transport system substrate-binding protein
MRKNYFLIWAVLAISLFNLACRSKTKNNTPAETRTSGQTTILVDETLDSFLKSHIAVFKSDYPDAEIKTIEGFEHEIMPKFASGEVKMLISTRLPKPNEERYYRKRKSPIDVDRIAIDGLAIINSVNSTDSTVTADDLFDVMKGKQKGNKKIVFDNAFSSTIRYFIDSAGIKKLPETGVYTLKTTDDVIKFVAQNKDYFGVIGLNWLLEKKQAQSQEIASIKLVAVKNSKGKKGSDSYYQPSQQNLISGKYPFLRNIYVINAEGTNGLGTGFANWLTSPRAQLLILKSGLGPHEIHEREFNYSTVKKK